MAKKSGGGGGGWSPLAYPSSAVLHRLLLLSISTPPSSCGSPGPAALTSKNDQAAPAGDEYDPSSYFPLHGDVLLAAIRELIVLDGTVDGRTLEVNPVSEDEDTRDTKTCNNDNNSGNANATGERVEKEGKESAKRPPAIGKRRKHDKRRRRCERSEEGLTTLPGRHLGYLRHLAVDGTVTPPIIPDADDGDEIIEMEGVGHINELKQEGETAVKRRKVSVDAEELTCSDDGAIEPVMDACNVGKKVEIRKCDSAAAKEEEEEKKPHKLKEVVPTAEFVAECIAKRAISFLATDLDMLKDDVAGASVAVKGEVTAQKEVRSIRCDKDDVTTSARPLGVSSTSLLPRSAAASLVLLKSNNVHSIAADGTAPHQTGSDLGASQQPPFITDDSGGGVPPMLHVSIQTESYLRHVALSMIESITQSFDEQSLRGFMGSLRRSPHAASVREGVG